MEIKWIYGNELTNKDTGAKASYFRKEFCVKRTDIKKAVITISALGIFKGYLNGKELDDDRLLPGWTNYDKNVIKYRFDVTNKIESNNCVGIILGNGWYSGKIGGSLVRYNYGNFPKLFVEISIKYSDGTEEIYNSCDGFKYSSGAIQENDLFDGEVCNQNDSVEGFANYGYNDKKWLNAKIFTTDGIKLIDSFGEKTCALKELDYIGKFTKDGKTVYDFGQNTSGVAKIKVVGKGKITIRYAEILDKNGNIYTENLRDAKATDIFYSVSGGVYEPILTYHGFRYVEIQTEGDVNVLEVKTVVISSNLKNTGDFCCNNKLFNQIYHNTRWGQISNFISIPTDCPQRDERLGWTGDAQVFCKTAMYNCNCHAFYKKYINDLINEQRENGIVPGFVPMQNFDLGPGFSAWGDVITILPYRTYLVYNDKDMLKQVLPSMIKWVDYCKDNSSGYICNCTGYGDWLTPNVDGPFESVNPADKTLISTAYFAHSADITAKVAKILNEDSVSKKYESLFENIKNAFREKYLLADGKINKDKQTEYLLAYTFNLVDKEEIKNAFISNVKDCGYLIDTGFLGTQYMYDVLCDMGESDIAYKMMANEDYPSLGFQIKNGATTIWERWDGFTPEKGFREPIMNSFNHYSLGACSSWFYEYVLGFRITEKNIGMNKLIMRPFIDKSQVVTEAKGEYNGVKVCWHFENDSAVYTIEDSKKRECDIIFEGFKIDKKTENGITTTYHLSLIK